MPLAGKELTLEKYFKKRTMENAMLQLEFALHTIVCEDDGS